MIKNKRGWDSVSISPLKINKAWVELCKFISLCKKKRGWDSVNISPLCKKYVGGTP